MATTKANVMAYLKSNADARGIAHWEKRSNVLKSYGIGLTHLRKYAKQIGRSHRLASSLWNSDVYEAKVLSLLIDEPQKMTIQQVESQVDGGLADGYLAHVFSSCDATLAKTSFVADLCQRWLDHSDAMRRRCAYGLLYELSKKPNAFDQGYWLERIEVIQASIHEEDMWVREAMNTALMGIGKRDPTLNRVAIAAAKSIGPVEIDYGADNQCEPLDVLKHLTSPHLKDKLAGKSRSKPGGHKKST
ncbi:MAG: DNA alkylation repair protein [Planctomycetota bacterium]